MYPKLSVHLDRLKLNATHLKNECDKYGIETMAVTKVFCGDPILAQTMIDSGITILADSRVSNLAKLQDLKATKVLLRLPMKSQAEEVVKYVDVSLNSEIETLKALSQAAQKQNKIHEVLLMTDLGDLREGVLPQDLMPLAKAVQALPNIKIKGIGVNLTCYGGVMPDENNLGQLVDLAKKVETACGIELEWISGGNSSSLYLLDQGKMPKQINNLRLGEAIVLGRETAFGDCIENTRTDAFVLHAELIELKEKESLPKGTIGMDAFGNHPTFEDKGKMIRGILAIGKQDVNPSGLIPVDSRIEIIGASSDHLLVDFTKAASDYKVGDILEFTLEYGALLSLYTSEYVEKEYI